MYFRPWTFTAVPVSWRATPHVSDLDYCQPRRVRGMRPAERSFAAAWKWYVRGNIVSVSSRRLVQNALKNIAMDSAEAAKDETLEEAAQEALPAGAFVEATPEKVQAMLRQGVDGAAAPRAASRRL